MSDHTPPVPPPGQPEPAGPGGSAAPAPAGASALSGLHKFDLGIIGAGVLAFIASLLPYYTVSVEMMGRSISDSGTAWHGFFGWFAALLAVAGAVLVALPTFGVKLAFPARLVALGLFALALVCVIIAGFTWPGSGDAKALGIDLDEITGHGFGYWLSVIVIAAGTVLAFLRKDAKD